MSKIPSKNTKPEMILRSALHQKGLRFRIHRRDLPGNPDIIFPKYKTVIFVHGCFWHYHEECREGRIPHSNSLYWREKISKNIQRDHAHQKACEVLGWKVVIAWECDIEKRLIFLVKEILGQLAS